MLPEEVAARPEDLPREDLDALYLAGYRTVGLGLGVFCVLSAAAYAVLGAGSAGWLRAQAFSLYALVFLAIGVAIQRGWATVRHTLSIAILASSVTTAGAFSPMLLLPQGASAHHDLSLVVVLVGFGAGFPRTGWLLAFLLPVLGLRFLLALRFPHLQGPLGLWSLHLAAAGVVSVLVHRLILGLVREQARLRRKDAHQVLELQEALARVRTLQGLIPICAHCKKIRDDTGFWQQVETYVEERSEAEFTHGICPTCAEDLRRELEG